MLPSHASKRISAPLQWVVDAYSVLFAGLVIFAAGSLGAAMMPDVNGLTACRAVMGVGAAFVRPSTLSILV